MCCKAKPIPRTQLSRPRTHAAFKAKVKDWSFKAKNKKTRKVSFFKTKAKAMDEHHCWSCSFVVMSCKL